MPRAQLPPATITLDKALARRFLLTHQRLRHPRSLRGKAGILDFIHHVGCIQFDPINIVGRNPDLVLQSRVVGYRPELLEELLYTDRQLLDGWDKVASIYLAIDRPFFARHRALMVEQHGDASNPPMKIAPMVLQAIRERGPLSSIDLKHTTKVDWAWGKQARLARSALEILYAMGRLGVNHRVNTRRFFDLIERLQPADRLAAPDPNETDQDYQDWHVLRRVGGLGLANPGASEYWGAILGVKSKVRRAVLTRLVARGDLVTVAVEGVPNRIFFVRAVDLPTFEAVKNEEAPKPEAVIIGPLDNLTWDRNLLRWIFDFDYVWEVYKPAAKRKYGYYVLPVLYDDRFVARLDPAFDKEARELVLTNWWWETRVRPDQTMHTALISCFRDFMRYLGADRVRLGEKLAGEQTLSWVLRLNRG